jgi:hypothetical protein
MSDATHHFCRASRMAGMLGLSLVLLSLYVAMGQPPEENDVQQEYNIKLAYLCNFGAYVTWPADSHSLGSDVWIIGVLGDDPFHGELDQIAASRREIRGRRIVARHFASLSNYQPCHILFVVKTVPPDQQEAAVRTLRGQRVLLVGEIAGFAVRGGCINFYREQENVRFEVNRDAVRGQELQISSKLLTLAKIVEPTLDRR